MLHVTQLIGFGAGIDIPVVQYTDTQTSTTTATTYNLTCNIGTAEPERRVAVCVWGSRATGTGATITSVTINGITATQVAQVAYDQYIHAIYIATVPTGTTGVTVTVVAGQSWGRMSASCFALYNLLSSTAVDTKTATSEPSTVSLSFSPNGVAVAMAGIQVSSGGYTWTNMTEVSDQNFSAETVSTAHTTSTTGETVSITASHSGSSAVAGAVFASFR